MSFKSEFQLYFFGSVHIFLEKIPEAGAGEFFQFFPEIQGAFSHRSLRIDMPQKQVQVFLPFRVLFYFLVQEIGDEGRFGIMEEVLLFGIRLGLRREGGVVPGPPAFITAVQPEQSVLQLIITQGGQRF